MAAANALILGEGGAACSLTADENLVREAIIDVRCAVVFVDVRRPSNLAIRLAMSHLL
ncbi:hypothetical protein DIPPA_05547 [Diplonema papillatum]|nr:hypothetical protein DIPPA_05547 [Diplonema papillatum]